MCTFGRQNVARLPGLLFLLAIATVDSPAQGVPLVYDEENTGASFPKPIFPPFDQLPIIRPLTDPFVFFDGSPRDTSFASWERRRNEIMGAIESFEIGPKPTRSDLTVTAVYVPGSNGGVLEVHVLRNSNGQSLTLTSTISLPSGSAPPEGFPAVIEMALAPGAGTGSLPAGIARIDYLHDDVTQYAAGQQISHAADPYFRMYPEYNAGPCPPAGPCGEDVGQYSAWSWGVSRLIDGMEIARNQPVNPLPIDIRHLAVHGCSYAGKMALFAGALDERIALTFAQESGGGGAPAWRVSQTLGNVEKLGSTDHSWFRESMFRFAGANVSKLPQDHHDLMAMVAPRALLVTGNTDYEWLANPSCYVSARATQRIYETFGIGDRFGFFIDGGHGHCAVPASQTPVINSFYNKFLLGDLTENTEVRVHPYQTVDYERWTHWWGSNDPVFPPIDTAGTEWTFYEAECASFGADWETFTDEEASNGAYLTVRAGLNSTGSAPAGDESAILLPFSVVRDTAYYFFARVNCPSGNDDSFWLKLDDGNWVVANGLTTDGWQWVDLTGSWTSTNLAGGDHLLTIAYREDGALLDKLAITSYIYGPEPVGLGGIATNCGGTGEISVSPSSLNFGNVNVGSGKSDSVIVTNTGTASLSISSAASDNAQFSVAPASGSLDPSASQTFYITFSPSEAGSVSGNIVFSHDAASSPDSVSVSGTGIDPSETVIIECDDSSVTRRGGWGDLDDARASSGRYCRNINGQPGKAYLELAFRGAQIELGMARGPLGGNAEVFIDGVSQGTVDFYRPASDPEEPDNSGRKDLTFGETMSFSVEDGEHTFRLSVLNDNEDNSKSIVYVDHFAIYSGSAESGASFTEWTTAGEGAVAPGASGVSVPVHVSLSTVEVTGILETEDGSSLSLMLLDPNGTLVVSAPSARVLEVIRWTPLVAGPHTFVLTNTQAEEGRYTFWSVATEAAASALAEQASRTSSMESATAGVPIATSVDQNYPNPFNPMTDIRYRVGVDSRQSTVVRPVRLIIFDLLGREVAVLVDGEKGVGTYTAVWDASGLPSGIYYYRLRAGDFVQTRKLLLLR